MKLDYQSPEALAPIVEALIFASDEPLSGQDLRALILGEDLEKELFASASQNLATTDGISEAEMMSIPEGATEESTEEHADFPRAEKKRKRKVLIELPVIYAAVEQLNERYGEHANSYRIIEIAGGYQFATRPEFSEYVVRLTKEKSRRRLSGAALETLAIVAYKQPVSKLDIENIRGVNCDEVLKSLLEKNLVTITGRAEAVGRPLLYGTTPDFLRHFGLPAISDLPRPREIDELMKEESIRATTLEEAASEFVSPQPEDAITVDEALAFAKEMPESEEGGSTHSFLDQRDVTGIELDIEALEETR